jgi:hypothetical protein
MGGGEGIFLGGCGWVGDGEWWTGDGRPGME